MNQPIHLFEAFAGYGSQAMALKRCGIPFESVGISEIDKYAIAAYNAIHGVTPNYGDISKIDWNKVPQFDLFTYSFPCTDISNAGKQQGFTENSGTRSSLLWECSRAIEAKKPKYLLMENVKALVQQQFIGDFKRWQNYLTSIGYTNFTQVLNAKDYGIPQNRERVFMVSILGDEWYNFPKPCKLNKCLGDVLESDVAKKYYLSQKMIGCFLRRNEVAKERGNGFNFKPNDITKPAKCVTTAAGTRTDDNFVVQQIGNIREDQGFENPQGGRIYSPHGLSPTLDTMQGGGREPKILQMSRGFNRGGQHELCPTITSSAWQDNNFLRGAKIRKLTPRECFRLMDVRDEDIDKMQNLSIYAAMSLHERINLGKKTSERLTLKSKLAISNTQQYKLAGNSIVVACLEHIFKQLFSEDKQQGMTLFG